MNDDRRLGIRIRARVPLNSECTCSRSRSVFPDAGRSRLSLSGFRNVVENFTEADARWSALTGVRAFGNQGIVFSRSRISCALICAPYNGPPCSKTFER